MSSDRARYVRTNTFPPGFFPVGLDTAGLIDVTCVGDSYTKLLDPQTGEIYDGAIYAAEAQRFAHLDDDPETTK